MSDELTKILIVDDRPENLLTLEAILEPLCKQHNTLLVRAASGEEALRRLLHEDFALILLDVQMPSMDGFETAAIIKERPRSRHIPIIFITAINVDRHHVFRGYSAGAVDYISKPFDPDILKSKVAVFIELFQKTQQIKEQGDRLREIEQLEAQRQMAERERELQQRHLAELAESEARLLHFKETLDATLDCVFIFDAQTLKFTYVNQGAIEQFGYDCDEFLNMSPLDMETGFDESSFRDMVMPLVKGEWASLLFERTARHKDGRTIPVEVFLQYMEPRSDKPRFIAIVRDITVRKQMEASLISAKDEAEAANRAKSEFLSSMSHELRTPLNAIIGFSKLLLNPQVGPLTEDQSTYLHDVVNSAEHLLALINDILDLSRIEAGNLTLEASMLCLTDVLQASVSVIREKARVHNLKLTTEIAPEISTLPPVVIDARKIKQILFNLLSNAAKFTPDGGSITLSAELDRESAIIRVRDTGTGIAPQDQERIFKEFEQVDSSYSRKQQGTGLGLALSRRLAEIHGGTLSVESTPGQGSVFTLHLPLRFASMNMQNGTSIEVPPLAAKAKKLTKSSGIAKRPEVVAAGVLAE